MERSLYLDVSYNIFHAFFVGFFPFKPLAFLTILEYVPLKIAVSCNLNYFPDAVNRTNSG